MAGEYMDGDETWMDGEGVWREGVGLGEDGVEVFLVEEQETKGPRGGRSRDKHEVCCAQCPDHPFESIAEHSK
jgi:hypothetical protein